MKTNIYEKYTLLEGDKGEGIEVFYKDLSHAVPHKFKNTHLIINLLHFENLQLLELIKLSEISTSHRKNKHSFVIVSKSIAVDAIPEAMIVVPTLQEAIDVLEMEAIERDLGF